MRGDHAVSRVDSSSSSQQQQQQQQRSKVALASAVFLVSCGRQRNNRVAWVLRFISTAVPGAKLRRLDSDHACREKPIFFVRAIALFLRQPAENMLYGAAQPGSRSGRGPRSRAIAAYLGKIFLAAAAAASVALYWSRGGFHIVPLVRQIIRYDRADPSSLCPCSYSYVPVSYDAFHLFMRAFCESKW